MTAGRGVRAPVREGVSPCRPRPRSRSAPPLHRRRLVRKPRPGVRTYVLDTSVLLADPGALRRFDEHEVVLPGRGDHRAGGQAAPPRAGLLRPRRRCGMLDELRVAHGRLDEPVPVGDEGGTLRVELNHTDADVAAVGLPARRQRHPDPRGGPQPRQRGPRRHAGLQGPAAADQGVRRRAGRRGVPRRGDQRLRHRLHRDGRARGRGRRPRRAVRRRRARPRGGPRPALPPGPGAALRPGHARWAGSARTSRCTWCAATARRSASTAAPPSSGSRSRCCSTPRSASSRSAAAPAPASPRWRCAPASRR